MKLHLITSVQALQRELKNPLHPKITGPIIITIAMMMWAFPVSCVLGAGSSTTTFSNTNTIIINGFSTPPVLATPYPSSIVVTGLTGQAITKVSVTIYSLTHSFPSDVDVLLVNPQGQMMFPMSSVGGSDRYPVTNITLTIEDDAALPLPLNSALTSGTFQPNKLEPTNFYDLPPPAPSGNSNAPASFSVFNGADPNGTWNLYVVENSAVDSGVISNGWSLAISSGVILKVAREQTNVLLSWTNTAVGYNLQSSPSLSPPISWSNVITAPVTVSGQWVVTNAVSPGSCFFQLAK